LQHRRAPRRETKLLALDQETEGSTEEFVGGELWASVLSDDSISDLQSHDYDVMEGLTKATQPKLKAA
jgi:hypothetical protein